MGIHIDTFGVALRNGDVIDLNQTVNGQNLFLVMTVEPLDIRYAHDLNRKYEYDKNDLLAPSKITGETSWEIVDNVYTLLFTYMLGQNNPAEGG